MPTNLSRRVAKLESETGATGRMMHLIDLSMLPHDCDHDSALVELGIETTEDDLVVILVNPTDTDPLPGAKPIHAYSRPL